MPPGTGPFANGNLHRVQTRTHVRGSTAAPTSRRSPAKLTTRDMFVPTCATCHMSGINGRGVTHDPSGRLSSYLFAQVSASGWGSRRGKNEGHLHASVTPQYCNSGD